MPFLLLVNERLRNFVLRSKSVLKKGSEPLGKQMARLGHQHNHTVRSQELLQLLMEVPTKSRPGHPVVIVSSVTVDNVIEKFFFSLLLYAVTHFKRELSSIHSFPPAVLFLVYL
jgi:hypothetical protein